jgi:hypothetical protein
MRPVPILLLTPKARPGCEVVTPSLPGCNCRPSYQQTVARHVETWIVCAPTVEVVNESVPWELAASVVVSVPLTYTL